LLHYWRALRRGAPTQPAGQAPTNSRAALQDLRSKKLINVKPTNSLTYKAIFVYCVSHQELSGHIAVSSALPHLSNNEDPHLHVVTMMINASTTGAATCTGFSAYHRVFSLPRCRRMGTPGWTFTPAPEVLMISTTNTEVKSTTNCPRSPAPFPLLCRLFVEQGVCRQPVPARPLARLCGDGLPQFRRGRFDEDGPWHIGASRLISCGGTWSTWRERTLSTPRRSGTRNAGAWGDAHRAAGTHRANDASRKRSHTALRRTAQPSPTHATCSATSCDKIAPA
jgi:hypothetical protein